MATKWVGDLRDSGNQQGVPISKKQSEIVRSFFFVVVLDSVADLVLNMFESWNNRNLWAIDSEDDTWSLRTHLNLSCLSLSLWMCVYTVSIYYYNQALIIQ